MKSEWTRMKSSVCHLRWNQIRLSCLAAARSPSRENSCPLFYYSLGSLRYLPQGRSHRVRIPLAVYCVIRRVRPTNSKFHPRKWIYSAEGGFSWKRLRIVWSPESFSGAGRNIRQRRNKTWFAIANIKDWSPAQKWKRCLISVRQASIFGAGDRTWTCTGVPLDPKSSASASSATPA